MRLCLKMNNKKGLGTLLSAEALRLVPSTREKIKSVGQIHQQELFCSHSFLVPSLLSPLRTQWGSCKEAECQQFVVRVAFLPPSGRAVVPTGHWVLWFIHRDEFHTHSRAPLSQICASPRVPECGCAGYLRKMSFLTSWDAFPEPKPGFNPGFRRD